MSEESQAARAARILVEELVAGGVESVCICPGSRSTPLTLAFAEHDSVRAFSHLDERAGSFFALGLAKVSRKPVALVCTSGTAAANFLPAVVEASLSRVPLVVLTADRPTELQDCGANQTIAQDGLYGLYPRFAATIPAMSIGPEDGSETAMRRLADRAVAEACGIRPGPVHLNCQFREPFAPRAEISSKTAVSDPPAQPHTSAHTRVQPQAVRIPAEVLDLLAASSRPLIVMGPRNPDDTETGENLQLLAERLGAAVFAEVTANVPALSDASGRVDAYDGLLRAGLPEELPDLIIRCGNVPTSKVLGRFLSSCDQVPQIVLAETGEWPDPNATATFLLAGPTEQLLATMAASLPAAPHPNPWAQRWVAAGVEARRRLEAHLDRVDAMEGTILRSVSRSLTAEDALFVGNSIAVRDLDLFCDPGQCAASVLVSRGASGIDGLVSTVFGIASGHAGSTIGVLGDVSFLHDAGGLLAAIRTPARAVLVVLDNDGGGIFDHLPLAEEGHPAFEDFFVTTHGRSIAGISRAWGVDATEVSPDDFEAALRTAVAAGESHVLVVRIDRAQSREAHRNVGELLARVPGWN